MALSASAVALAVGAGDSDFKDSQAVFPMLLAGAGIVAAILGTFVVRSGEQADFERLLWALRYGIFSAGGILVVFAAILTITLTDNWWWFGCVVAGLIAGTIIGLATEYFTSYSYSPTKKVSESSQTGRRHRDHQRHRHRHDEHPDSGHLRVRGHPVGLLVRRVLRRGPGRGWAAFHLGHHLGHRRLRPRGRQRRRHRRTGQPGPPGPAAHRCLWTPWATPRRPPARVSP